MPVYLLVLPFLAGGLKRAIKNYKYDVDIRSISKAVLLYSIILLAIDLLHGNLINSFFQIFVLNILMLIIGIELYTFAKQDIKFKGHKYLLIVFLINAVIAVLQSINGNAFWEIPDMINLALNKQAYNKYLGVDFESFRRVRGLFLYVHKFSPAIMAVSIFFFFKTYISKRKIIYLCSALLMLFAAIFTQTRSILVGLVLGVFISYFFYFKSNKLKIFAFTILTIIIVFIFNPDIATKLFERVSISNSNILADTDLYRLRGINFSIQKFLNNPLIGSSEKLYISSSESLTVHGVLFRILGDYGAIGLITYISTFVSVIVTIYKRSTNTFKSLFTVVLSVFIIDLLTHSSGFLFYDLFQFPFLVLLYGYSKNRNLQSI